MRLSVAPRAPGGVVPVDRQTGYPIHALPEAPLRIGYDRFSAFYDLALDGIYRPYRAELARRLQLSPGEIVLDLACGTGQNLDRLLPPVLPGGKYIGVDASSGMLARAQARAERQGVAEHTRFACCDARALDPARLLSLTGIERPDAVVVALGLTVIPEWQAVFEATFALLGPGGRYAIFDVHAERRVLQTAIVEWMAEADLARRPWEPLQRASVDFALHWTAGSPHVFGGRPFIATGRRA